MKTSRILKATMVVTTAIFLTSCAMVITPSGNPQPTDGSTAGSSAGAGNIYIAGGIDYQFAYYSVADQKWNICDVPNSDVPVAFMSGGYTPRMALDSSGKIYMTAAYVQGTKSIFGVCEGTKFVELPTPVNADFGEMKIKALYGIAVSSNDETLVIGSVTDAIDNYHGVIWKAGVPSLLMTNDESITSAEPNSIVVDGKDVYISGTVLIQSSQTSSTGTGFWKNGAWNNIGCKVQVASKGAVALAGAALSFYDGKLYQVTSYKGADANQHVGYCTNNATYTELYSGGTGITAIFITKFFVTKDGAYIAADVTANSKKKAVIMAASVSSALASVDADNIAYVYGLALDNNGDLWAVGANMKPKDLTTAVATMWDKNAKPQYFPQDGKMTAFSDIVVAP
ncbi:MAG: hypothetical protein WCQ53_04545 [bacterium]